MKEKKRNKSIVKETIGDPAFYNDQIDQNKKPAKSMYDTKKGSKGKS